MIRRSPGDREPPKTYEEFVARFDVNKDGDVDTTETVGPAKRMDADQDGMISREEFDKARAFLNRIDRRPPRKN